jgi:hypothetical protein
MSPAANAPDSFELPVVVEYRGRDSHAGEEVHHTSSAFRLFVDRARNRFGVKSENGDVYYVPLSSVLEILRKGVL